jgi:hypothetical protein
MITRYLLTSLFLLALASGSRFVLYVNDLDGAPVAGVTFTLQDADGQRHTATTDATGQARIDGLPGSSVRIVQATYQGQKLTMDSNGPDRSGLTIPLAVGGEQRLAMDMAEGFIGVALQQPPPAQPFPTNTLEPTRTPRPRPTPTDTPTPSSTEAPTLAAPTTPASSPTTAQIAALQPTSGLGAAPVAATAAPDVPAAGTKHLDQNLLMAVLIWIALPLVALGYALWRWWRKP